MLMMPVQQDIHLEDGGDVCMHYLPLSDEVSHPCTFTSCLHHLCLDNKNNNNNNKNMFQLMMS